MTWELWQLPAVFESEQGTLRYAVFGAGPPLVLIHGTPWSSWLWRRVAAELATGATVYVYDLPGYGSSAKFAGQDVSIGAQGRILAALLDHWGLEQPAVAAHDIGGAIALRSHLLHGRQFSRIALLDVVALAPWGTDFAQLVRRHADIFAQVPAPMYQGMLAGYIRSAAHRELPQASLQALMQPWLGDAGQAAFFRQIAQFDQRYTDEFEALLPKLDVPVQILWGAQDSWILLERGRRLQALLPQAALRIIDEAGHLLLEETPEIVSWELREFFA